MRSVHINRTSCISVMEGYCPNNSTDTYKLLLIWENGVSPNNTRGLHEGLSGFFVEMKWKIDNTSNNLEDALFNLSFLNQINCVIELINK